jgi:hypothetical protein
MNIEHFQSMNSTASSVGLPVRARIDGTVGAPVGCNECSSGWWLFGGFVLGVAGTLATQAFGPMVKSQAKTGIKHRAASW